MGEGAGEQPGVLGRQIANEVRSRRRERRRVLKRPAGGAYGSPELLIAVNRSDSSQVSWPHSKKREPARVPSFYGHANSRTYEAIASLAA